VLTRSGVGVLVGSLLATGFGLRWRYVEFVALGVVGMVTVLVAVLSASRGQRLDITRRLVAPRVTRGDDLQLRYTVRNTSARRQPACVLVDRCADAELRIPLPATAARQSREWSGALTMRRRGIFESGPLTTTQSDVLGLAEGQRRYHGTAEVWVQPRARTLGPTRGATRSANDEANAVRRMGDPLAGFHSLRPYIVGDDTRLIHWPSTAKTGDLMVREFVDARRPQFSIVVDADIGSASDDEFEEAVDVAASLAVAALRDELDVVVRTTQSLNSGSPRRVRSVQEALDLLTRVEQTATKDTLSLGAIFGGGYPEGVVIVVTGPTGPAPSLVAPRSDVRVVRIGQNAVTAPALGVSFAAPDADSFARLWSGVE
jgi:uncharacterized protein (DUF58 family)